MQLRRVRTADGIEVHACEIGFVLARQLFNATADEAVDAIGAFVVLNDLSARDVQRAEMDSGFGPQKSKHCTTSLSRLTRSCPVSTPCRKR